MRARIDRAFAALLRLLGWCQKGESFWCAHCVGHSVVVSRPDEPPYEYGVVGTDRKGNVIPFPLHPVPPRPFTEDEHVRFARAAARMNTMPLEIVRDGVVLYRIVDGKCVPVAQEMK